VARIPGGHHVQTSLWAQVKAGVGWRGLRIIAVSDEQIIGGAQLLLRALPAFGTIGYVPQGPQVSIEHPALRQPLLDEVIRVATVQRVRYLQVQPPRTGEPFVRQLLDRRFFLSALAEMTPTATVLIDLTQDLAVLEAQMAKATRYRLRRGARKGVMVRDGTASDISTFYRLLQQTGQRKRFTPESEIFYVTMWRVFQPQGHVKLFFAEVGGVPVSTLWLIPFGDTVTYKRGGWSGQQGSYQPNEAIHWAAIQWAKAQGYHYYDLEGIDRNAAEVLTRGEPLPDSAKQSQTSFKLGFGGHVRLLPEVYEYLPNPMLRWAYATIFAKVARSPLLVTALNRLRTR
jgi:lipid II:glycine glycyltransferase (peptidoglycan interpeptide bridge formation enzyme)